MQFRPGLCRKYGQSEKPESVEKDLQLLYNSHVRGRCHEQDLSEGV